MPELPEVEVCRRGLLPHVEGQRIDGAVVRFPRLRHELPADLGATLAGRTIAALERRGKYLLFDCRRGADRGWLIVHLGMSGNLRLVETDRPPQRHDHVDLLLPGAVLRYSDPRRFGVIDWWPGAAPDRHPLLAVLGVEPLAAEFTGDWLYAATRRRGSAIKTVLMDSHLLVGVGNIYASESLFRAGISPLRAASRIGRARCAELAAAVRATLGAAIAAGGSSIRDYLHSDGSSGYFQLECAVYGRAGAACRRCGGAIRQIRQGGRSPFYCPACQH